ncbi:MAG TPA: polynucleotide adenylyltransferase PcnB [Rhodanobacteraceae bacterium]|jgi:poly(A) polymerase|nr:polynucleotide adenylyltransferase PcnB [Rhodanobacteraceae bacterium]
MDVFRLSSDPPASGHARPLPRVIPREQHNVSRKQISRGALKVLYGLKDAGFRACLVGGAVRDLLLGRQPKDFDIATDATPEDVKRLFRNCRLIGRRFRLAHVIFGPEIVEVATFRGTGGLDASEDRHVVDGRILRDNVWGSIEEDALRRDFRVNALYYDIADFSVIDYVGGIEDLEQKHLRLIGDPATRYREDPVRMLRAARLAAKLHFEIDAEAAAPLHELGHLLEEAPSARLFDECQKMFLAGYGLASFRMLVKYDLLRHLFPGTVRALAHDESGALLGLIERGLAGTDARVADGRPVTPAFLFAVLLWGEVKALAEKLHAEGAAQSLAWQRAAHRVMAEQGRRVAIPRRFGYTIEDIWSLQPRFTERTRKRVFRLMAHPRFRAAYDFLLLRAGESDALRESGAWWTEIQALPPDQISEQLAPRAPAAASSERPAGSLRRRRRGGRRHKAAAPKTGSPE